MSYDPTCPSCITPTFAGLFTIRGKIANVLRTRLPLIMISIATSHNSLDLHALATPPAFILSQDQTLSNDTIGFLLNRIKDH